MEYVKSSFCDSSACLEVGSPAPGNILLRLSEDPDKVLAVTKPEWDAFVLGIRAGEFDRIEQI